jgi:hypothetical protein
MGLVETWSTLIIDAQLRETPPNFFAPTWSQSNHWSSACHQFIQAPHLVVSSFRILSLYTHNYSKRLDEQTIPYTKNNPNKIQHRRVLLSKCHKKCWRLSSNFFHREYSYQESTQLQQTLLQWLSKKKIVPKYVIIQEGSE